VQRVALTAFEHLEMVIGRLEGLGATRTADDLRVIAREMRDDPDGRESTRVDELAARLERVRVRLTLGGYREHAAGIAAVLAELRRSR
jgi:hypothetical protein